MTNDWCRTLGIEPPTLTVVAHHREANTFALLRCCRGSPHRNGALHLGRRWRSCPRPQRWLFMPSSYGTYVQMKKTLHIDDRLLAEARTACRATTDTETIRLGLEALIRRAAYERLRKLAGSEAGVAGVPRRRESRRSGRGSKPRAA